MSNPFETFNIISLPTIGLSLIISADGENLWVTDTDTNKLYKIPYNNSNLFSVIEVNNINYATSGPSSNGTYVGMLGALNISTFKLCIMKCNDPTNTQNLISLPYVCNAISLDNNYVWCSSAKSAQIIYQFSFSGTLLSSIPMPANANIISLSSDGTNLWAATTGESNYEYHTITKVSCNDVSNVSTIDLGINNKAPISISSDGTNVWVAVPGYSGENLKNVIKISCSTLITSEITMNSSPYSVSSNGTYCFVCCLSVNLLENGVYIIDCDSSDILQPKLSDGIIPVSTVAYNGKYGWGSDRAANGPPTLIYQYGISSYLPQLEDPYNVNFIAPGRESNDQWTNALTTTSTSNSYPLKQNWSSIATSSDGKFVLACVNGGQIYSSSNYGYDLQPVSSSILPSSASWSCIKISPDGTKAVACINNTSSNGGVYTASLIGTSWTWTKSTLESTNWSSVSFSGDSLNIATVISNLSQTNPIYIGTQQTSGIWTWVSIIPPFPNPPPDQKVLWSSITNLGTQKDFVACIHANSNNSITGIYALNYNNNTWILNQINTNNSNWTSICCNLNGNIIYVCNSSSSSLTLGIYKLVYNNPSWIGNSTSAPTPKAWTSIATDSTGQYVVACVNEGGLYSSIDYGNSWQEQTTGLPTSALWTCVAIESNSAGSFLLGCAQNDYIYISPYFQGYQWNNSFGQYSSDNTTHNNNWSSIASDSTGQNIIGCIFGENNGYIYISNDFGITWTKQDSVDFGLSGSQYWNFVSSNSDGSILGAVLWTGATYIINYNSFSWTLQNLEPNGSTDIPNCNQMSFNSSGSHAVVCSYYTTNGSLTGNGKIYFTNNTSLNVWTDITPLSIPTSITYLTYWTAIKLSSDHKCIYACYWSIDISNISSPTPTESGIYKGVIDSSENWNWTAIKSDSISSTSGLIYYYNSITCSDDYSIIGATNINEGAANSFIWISKNGGSFNSTNLGQSVTVVSYGFQCITMDSTGNKIATVFYNNTGGSGNVYTSFDKGTNWISQIKDLPQTQNNWRTISSNQDMSKLVIASNYVTNGGTYDSSGIFTAFLSKSCWTPQLNAVPTRNCFTKLTSSNNGQYLAVVAENQNNNNDYGGIWISWDNGSTWIKSDAGNFCWNAISSDNTGQYLVAGVYGGQIYTSSNYGLNWVIQSSNSGLPTSGNWTSISFSNNSDSSSTSQYVYAQVSQTSNSNIYYSTNKGITWIQTLGQAIWNNGIASSSDGFYAFYGVNNPSTGGPGGYGIYKTTSNDLNFNQINSNPGYWNYIACDKTGQYVVAVLSDVSEDYANTGYGIWLNTNYGDGGTLSWTQLASKNLYWTSISLVNMGNYLLINAICINGLVYTCNYNLNITNPNPNPFYETTGGNWVENIIDNNYTLTCTQGDANTNIKFNDSILVNVTVVGGGGAGSGLATYLGNDNLGGGGGGGGIALKSFYTINQLPYTTIVGTGGSGKLSKDGNPGTNSLFSDGNFLNIKGFGGGAGSSPSGGAGGTGEGGTNYYLGGNGGNSGISGNDSGLPPYSGSGAGGSDINGSYAGGYAGNAGIGGALQFTSIYGQSATTYGSGGGGVGYYPGEFGGSGYSGVIIITFTPYTWTLQGNIPTSQWNDIKSSVLPSGDVQLVICSTNGGIWKSSDSGATWSQSVFANTSFNNSSYQTAITSSSTGQNLAAIVNYGLLYSSTDFGSSWNSLPNSLPLYTYMNWTSITSSITGQYIYASTIIGEIYKSENYGQTWNKSVVTYAYPILSMSSSGQYIAAASNGGSIYLSSDYGSIWTQLTTVNGLPSIIEAWSAISLSATGQYMAASINNGNIYKSSDYGTSWSNINLISGHWSSIAISDSGQYIVATINGGAIYGSSDFGFSLSKIYSSFQNWSSITISGTGQYITASTNDGKVFSSSNFGLAWIQNNTTTANLFNSITSSKSGQYLATIGVNSTTSSETDIYIYSNYMDIGNIYGSLINQLQILIQP